MERNTVKHSAYSTCRCQYPIVFAPGFRRRVLYGQLKKNIGRILRKLCEEKKVEIIKAEGRHFGCRGSYVDTVGKNKRAIEEYIRNQLVEDEMMDQMTMKEYMDPFTGSKNRKA